MRVLWWIWGRSPARTGPEPEKNAWVPTHRHKKGGLYRLIGYGTNEADRATVAIYDDATGAVWVRNAAEFNDGRFDLLE